MNFYRNAIEFNGNIFRTLLIRQSFLEFILKSALTWNGFLLLSTWIIKHCPLAELSEKILKMKEAPHHKNIIYALKFPSAQFKIFSL